MGGKSEFKLKIDIPKEIQSYLKDIAKKKGFKEGEWGFKIFGAIVGGLLMFDVEKISELDAHPYMELMYDGSYNGYGFPIYFDRTQRDYVPDTIALHFNNKGDGLDFN